MRVFLLILIINTLLLSCVTDESLIFESVEEGGFGEFKELILRNNKLINATNVNGTPLLVYCMKYKRDSMTSYLLERNVDVDAVDKEGRSALFYVYSPVMVKNLIAQGANVNLQDSFGKAPLHLYQDILMYDELIKYSLDRLKVNIRDHQKKTPLMYAILEDDVDKVSILLNYGADIHFKDKYENDCIHYANASGNPTIIKMIQAEYNEFVIKNTLSVEKIFGATFNLKGSSFNSKNSIAVNDLSIPLSSDELIIIGYSGSSKPSEYLFLLNELAEIGTTIYSDKASRIYEKLKEINSEFANSDSQVDFYLTYKNDGDILARNPSFEVRERFLKWHNTSGFKDVIARNDLLPPDNLMSVVVKNKDRINQASFRVEIFSVSKPNSENLDEENLHVVNDKKVENNASTVVEMNVLPSIGKKNTKRNVQYTPKEEDQITSYKPQVKVSFSPNTFYEYPSMKPISISENYLIQGAAKNTLEEAQKYAMLYSRVPNLDVVIYRKYSGIAPFKVFVEMADSKESAKRRKNYIRTNYESVGDLHEAFIVTRHKLMEY
ncbi:MAG: ankyrin repeat domain-containing protein [Chitinophagales bacterium]|nr:ankyrin repeat domain-containing protein [Chitinophagales bacterium]